VETCRAGQEEVRTAGHPVVVHLPTGGPVDLPAAVQDLLRRPSPCFLATLMPDGSPQVTQTWVDTDGTHVLVNTVEGHQKVRNVRRDPRVSLDVADPEDVSSYVEVRGRVVEITPEGAAAHIEQLARRYLGRSYPGFGGRDGARLLLRIEADAVRSPRG
jgi:PPOX class probable F420-dependent enzyme